jgi:hypothetical protein
LPAGSQPHSGVVDLELWGTAQSARSARSGLGIYLWLMWLTRSWRLELLMFCDEKMSLIIALKV